MPSPSTRQSHMETFLGKAPGIDSNHIIDDIAFKLNILTKTSDYTLLASESGSLVLTAGATADVEFTLPSPADGLVYFFYNAVDVEMKVTGSTADELVAFNDASADSVAYTTASEHIGGALMVFADADYWYVAAMPYGLGTTAQTVTVGT